MDSDRLSMARLYARTASRMRPSQLRGVAERKARQALVHRLPVDFDRRYERRIPDSLALHASPVAANANALRESVDPDARRRARERASRAATGTVSFLNRSVSFPEPTRPAWEADELDDLPRLWRLKLYAFEPLDWLVVGHADPADAREEAAVLDEWVRDWCARAEVGGPNYLRTTWTPYSVSLRLLHWTRYLAWRIEGDGATGTDADPPTATLARELYKNALFLRNHVERGVGGNHLIENGAALAVAGLFVGEDDWTREGVDVLAHAGRTQFLDDGGHYERSPMYHVLTTTRYLTVCDLLRRTGREVPAALRRTARDTVGFLRTLRPPDGRLPLLNDSVHGQGLSLDACLRYARRTGVVAGEGDESDGGGGGAVRTGASGDDGCAASGYHWLSTDAGRLLVDGGPLGPSHLPGHAHVDLLSFLLWLDGRPVVTDTGAFDYEAGERRTYARGVRGHNTVQVGDAEPVELGGRFLLGRRVEPTVRRERARGVDHFEGRYVAPSPAADGYVHYRSIHAGDDWWLVWDRVRGAGSRAVRGRLHLHPDIAPTQETDGIRLAVGVEDDRTAGWLRPLLVDGVDVTQSEYYPRFGDARTRSTLELRARGGDAVAFGAIVTGADVGPDRVDVSLGEDGGVDAVAFDGESRRVPRATLAPSGGSDDTNDLYEFLR